MTPTPTKISPAHCRDCIKLSECSYEFGAHPDDQACTGFREPLRRWPCVHGTDCDGTGLDCGPDQSRKKPAPKSADELSDIRARAWETRRAKYGQTGHHGGYAR